MVTVLTVDDEPVVHHMVELIISESGLPAKLVGTAVNGCQALELACELRPDICLLDIHMDDTDGLDLADRLRESLDYSPRIIYLTAYSRFEYAQRAMRLGAADYVLKPINRKEFIAALRRVINSIQAERLEQIEQNRLKHQIESVLPAIASPADTADKNRLESTAAIVRRFVEDHYHEKISLLSAADHVNLSPGYLGSIFKRATGISFRAYLRSVRIVRARELMADPRLNLTEIANAVGYEDLNYFSEAFLQETGVRPSDYRGGGKQWAK